MRVTRESPFISGSPTVSATISGVKATAQASSALSSTGISSTIPRSRSGAAEATSSVVFAPSDVPPTTASSTLEVVEQRDHVAGEEAHAVAPHVRRPVRAAVAVAGRA